MLMHNSLCSCNVVSLSVQVILGPSVELTGVKPGSHLTKDQFVSAMSAALKQGSPYSAA
jgi:hypothetical protein